MNTIKDEIRAVLDDMVLAVGEVVMRMALGEFGELPDETMERIARGLGVAVAEVQLRADPEDKQRVEE